MTDEPLVEPATPEDEAAIEAQLGRAPRAIAGIGWRCPCGKPGVVATLPRLPNGDPFPTTFYLTCPRASSACSTLESEGVMRDMADRLGTDADLKASYEEAHAAYLSARSALSQGEVVPEIENVTAGGMPDRVKCLHSLLAHSLAAGPGVNPLGDETAELIGEFWRRPCLPDVVEDES